MTHVLSAILPIFALILAGWALARAKKLGAAAIEALNLYVVWIALPALLFRFVATADPAAIDRPGFLLVFGGGTLATFVVSALAASLRHPRPRLARRSLDALTASYANTAYMGIPILAGLLGPTGIAAGVIASLVTVCALFAIAVVLVEIDLSGSGLSAVGRVAGRVICNPIVAAPLLGAIWMAIGPPLPTVLDSALSLAGGSATPVALATIGAFLAQPRGGAVPLRPLAAAVAIKLLGQPLLTAALLLAVPLPRDWAVSVLILAALPTGTGPFMLAQLFHQEVALAARATLVSTILSALSVTALAWWLLG